MGLLLQLYHWMRGDILPVPGRLIAAVWVILLVLIPWILPEPILAPALRILTVSAIFAIFAASWDLLAGFTGQVNLGHALFFGVSAYTAALLNLRLGFPAWATIPLGALAAMITGFITCLPALRLRGMYLALVTLALPLILTGFIYMFKDFTGGEYGLPGITPFALSAVGKYYLISAVMLGSVLTMWKLTDMRSKLVRTGVILQAIREDEIAARMAGIKTTRYKAATFALSGLFCGIAGGLFAHYFRVVGPTTLELNLSFSALVWTIFGGMGTIYGPVTGVYLLYPLVEFLRLNALGSELRFVVQAVLLMIVLIVMPQGITVWVRDNMEQMCPRCKLVNRANRRTCRACRAPLYRETKEATEEVV